MNAIEVLARIFGALETFITHFHASLVLIVRAVSTVTLDTSGVTRQFALHLDMTVNRRHTNLSGQGRHTEFHEASGLVR